MFIALKSDIKSYKITNKVILIFIALGLITNCIVGGFSGCKSSLLGCAIPVAFLFVLYALKMLGAADVKLFSALGAVFGAQYIIEIMVYSFIAGGVVALVLICVRKNAKERLLHLFNYFKFLITTFKYTPYTEFSDKDDSGKFPFAYAVFFGTILFMIVLLLSNCGIALHLNI